MQEPIFRYEVNGEMKEYTLYQIFYDYLPKDVLHPEDYRGQWTGKLDSKGNNIFE